MLIPVGLDLYAVAATAIRAVVAVPGLCPLPTGPSTVLGVFNLRGEIVPLLDTAALLGTGRLSEPPFAAVVQTTMGLAALAASGLPESVVLDESVGGSETPGTLGVYSIGGRLAALVDVEELLTPARIS